MNNYNYLGFCILITFLISTNNAISDKNNNKNTNSEYQKRIFSIQRTVALPKVSMVSNKNHHVLVEIANSIEERSQGLMFRKFMEQNQGMLFVFPGKENQCFWMKNTLLPLSIAFLDDQGTIVRLDEMEAKTENPHCSYHPVRYALEMNQNWFQKNGLSVGDKIFKEAE